MSENPQTVMRPLNYQSLGEMPSVKWDWVRHATSSDLAMYSLLSLIESSSPPNSKDDRPELIREYHELQTHALCGWSCHVQVQDYDPTVTQAISPNSPAFSSSRSNTHDVMH